MNQLLKPFQILYCIYAIVLFLVLLLLLMPFFVAASFFGRIKGGNIMYRICSIWSDIWLLMIGIYTKVIHEHPLAEIRPCVFVANHISYMDIPMVVKTVREKIRPLGKAEMSKVPLFGFMYKYVVVMVERSNAENRSKSVQVMKSVLEKGISIFIFPEGTFNETGNTLKDFYDGAFRIAIGTQSPIQPVIYPDTIKRMHYSSIFSITPGLSRAIFLDLIPVDGYTMETLPQLKQLVYDKMEAGLLKYQQH